MNGLETKHVMKTRGYHVETVGDYRSGRNEKYGYDNGAQIKGYSGDGWIIAQIKNSEAISFECLRRCDGTMKTTLSLDSAMCFMENADTGKGE